MPQPSRRHLLLYAVGSLGTALSYQDFSTYIQFLYIDILGLRTAWIGIIWSLYGLWNAINFLSGFSLRGEKLAAVQVDCMALHELKRAAIQSPES